MRDVEAGSIVDVTVLERLAECGVLPVVQPPTGSFAEELAAVLVDAGLPAIEVTFRAEGAPAAIERMRAHRPDMLVGAGTVLSIGQARSAMAAGAQFLVTPGTNPAIVELAQAAGLPIIPGIATPTEIEANLARGIEVMKLFPAEVLGGVRFLKAIHGPYRAVRFMPTGGISPGNLADYLAQPNVLACGGTWIAPPDASSGDDLAGIARRAGEAAAIVRASRAGDDAGGSAG